MDRRSFLLSAATAMMPAVLNGDDSNSGVVEFGCEVVVIRDPSEFTYVIGNKGKEATQFREGEHVAAGFHKIDDVTGAVRLISSMIMDNERKSGLWTVRMFRDGDLVAIVGYGPSSRAYKVKRIVV